MNFIYLFVCLLVYFNSENLLTCLILEHSKTCQEVYCVFSISVYPY